MDLRPVDMPTLRQEAILSAEQRGVQSFRASMENFPSVTARNLDPLARKFAAAHVQTLGRAELFFVEETMMRLARVAAATLDATDLQVWDLPAPEGLAYLQGTLRLDGDGWDGVCAVSWKLHKLDDGPGLEIVWFNSAEGLRRAASRDGWEPGFPVLNINQHLFTRWPVVSGGTITVDGSTTALNDTGEGRAVAVLVSIWHLMRQSLAAVNSAAYDRAAVRRLRKAGREPEPVRVVTLRRRDSGEGDGSDREYHVQWVVRGHWRQQPCGPARSQVRPIWIAPHIKGPEDAPLLGGEKVYALKR